MKKRIRVLVLTVLAALAVYALWLYPREAGTPVQPLPPHYKKTILLVPLDSRPPCQQLVIDTALMDNIKVIVPPPEVLDYYYAAGDTKALAKWLRENFAAADAALLSVDQLLHGGLIASREGKRSAADSQQVISLLRELHQKSPAIPIYAFNILPRITPPPSIGGYSLWDDFIELSRLTDQLALAPDKKKQARLDELKKKLPAKDLAQYLALYENNYELNKSLARLVRDGTLKMAVLGQDDGEEFGIPNMKKRQLQKYLAAENISSDKFFITHGADELALSLLSKLSAEEHHYQPKVYIEYNPPYIRDYIMPYMAGPVEATLKEKLGLLNAVTVSTPAEADLTLFISCVNKEIPDTRRRSADRLKELIAAGCTPALVDLSEHFLAEETVFPFLLSRGVPLQELAAYAGWNTTSNSIGTAVSQAVIFAAAKKDLKSRGEALFLWQNKLTLLNNRFLEDYYYLKDIIDRVNLGLNRAGYVYVNDLDMDRNYRWANAMLQTSLAERAGRLRHTTAFRTPAKVTWPGGSLRLQVKKLAIDTCYPWPRTFEIYLRTTPALEVLNINRTAAN